METGQDIYANSNDITERKLDCQDSKNVPFFSNNLYEGMSMDEDDQGTHITTKNLGLNTAWSQWYRVTVRCVILLCVLLLTVVIVLGIKFNNLNTEKDELQTNCNTLTIERDHVQTSYNNLTIARDQLQTSYNNLTKEGDQVQTRFNTLTKERNQLQTSYNTMTKERDQLQTSYNTLTKERDQLQTSYNTLTKDRDQLQNHYKRLTIDRDQLQHNNSKLNREKDQQEAKLKELMNKITTLQASYYTMTNKNDELQKEKDALQKKLAAIDSQVSIGWRYFNSRVYYISTEKKTWSDSRQYCINSGADLVIINSKEKQEFLVEQLDGSRAWIGLSDGVEEGLWKWVDGTPLTTPYWSHGEPNNSGDEDCAELGAPDSKRWNDRPCSDMESCICEKMLLSN